MQKLFPEFPAITDAEWEAAVRADLKGADFARRLVWNTAEGIAVQPYYRAGSSTPLPTRQTQPGWTIFEEESAIAVTIDAAKFGDEGATAVQELGYALLDGIDHLDAGGDRNVTFSFSVGSSYFLEIAKLRAFRSLWDQVLAAFGIAGASTRIHCRPSRWNQCVYDPHVNILRATTAAMAAAAGGADSILIEPYDQIGGAASEAGRRLARNTQLLLQHEAHFDRVADPAAGSYYIEAITVALAREAWKLMQQRPTDRAADIARSRAIKESAVAHRQRVLVGVNQYPNPDDHAAAPPSAGRAASGFEALRYRTEQSMKRPRLLLAEIGDAKMSRARSQFALNLFGCAGFISETRAFAGAGQVDAAGFDAVVLCSSDVEYPSLVPAVLREIAGLPLIVAGPPQEIPGVAGFVHARADALATLAYWQSALGVTHAA